jgi:molybdenum cofactor cytidylyltransferase
VASSARHLPALLELHGDRGARAIVRANPVCEVDVDDPGILLDIDSASDLSASDLALSDPMKNGTLQP